MAPGPEVPRGPFEDKKTKIGNLILVNLREPQAQTELIGIRAMLWGHHFRVPTTLGCPSFQGAHHLRGYSL